MKKIFFLLEAVAVAVLVMQVFASDQKMVTVKQIFKNNGVIILTGNVEGKPLQLQCNIDMPNCKSPEPGNYAMVELPKNHGIYMDCVNADLYRTTNGTEAPDQIGEYCLMK